MGKIMVKGIMYGGGDQSNQNLADEFNTSSTYAVDDYVIYNQDLYQCTTAVSTAGPWDSTKWMKKQITNVMGGGGAGDVADVYVNGQSVLDSNKIAQITNYVELTQAEYDALPASKLTDNVLYCIKDKATADTTVAPIIYSEEEREVGVWTDGKPLYQTTIHTGALTKDGNWHTIAHNIPNIDKIILCTGTVYAADNTAYFMPNYRPGLTQGICLDVTTTNIEYIQNWLDSSPDSYVTLQYTKTTDQPGSGKYAPSGVPAVHYSENEQVVGTWVDGSAIYEKTFNVGYLTSSTKSIAHEINNLGHVVQIYGYVTNNTYNFPMPYVTTDAASCIGITVDATNINIISINRNDYYGYVTIRYTKSTT